MGPNCSTAGGLPTASRKQEMLVLEKRPSLAAKRPQTPSAKERGSVRKLDWAVHPRLGHTKVRSDPMPAASRHLCPRCQNRACKLRMVETTAAAWPATPRQISHPQRGTFRHTNSAIEIRIWHLAASLLKRPGWRRIPAILAQLLKCCSQLTGNLPGKPPQFRGNKLVWGTEVGLTLPLRAPTAWKLKQNICGEKKTVVGPHS